MGKVDKRIGTVVMGHIIEVMIGWGGSSKVYRASNTMTGHKVAIKVISKPRSRIGDLQRTITECTILSKLKHPNIVNMVEWYETDKHLYIIMELAKNGDLLEALQKRRSPFPEETIKMWFAQLVDALEFTHLNCYIHKDIKLDNVLLDGNRILLADWGFAHTYDHTSRTMSRIFSGTDGYWAPEIATNTPFVGPEVDCWSLGVTLYALAAARLPFDCNSRNYQHNLLSGSFAIPPHFSNDLRSMICGLLSADPIVRYTLQDVQSHPFYASAVLPRSPPMQLSLSPSSFLNPSPAVSRRYTPTGDCNSSSISRLATPTNCSGSEIHGRIRRPTTTIVTVNVNMNELLVPVPSPEERIARVPASPPHSACSSRTGSAIGSRIGAKEKEKEEITKETSEKVATPSISAAPASCANKARKSKGVLKSVISSLKKFAALA